VSGNQDRIPAGIDRYDPEIAHDDNFHAWPYMTENRAGAYVLYDEHMTLVRELERDLVDSRRMHTEMCEEVAKLTAIIFNNGKPKADLTYIKNMVLHARSACKSRIEVKVDQLEALIKALE
jgi:hypothetical protein